MNKRTASRLFPYQTDGEDNIFPTREETTMARKRTAAERLEQRSERSTARQTIAGDRQNAVHYAPHSVSAGQVAEPDNIVLDHLRALRSDMAAMREDIREVKSRVTSLEHSVAGIFAEVANLNDRHDRILHRIERIERRLEFTG